MLKALGRRGFLRSLVTTPLAAKAALDENIADLVGLRADGRGAGFVAPYPNQPQIDPSKTSFTEASAKYTKFQTFVKMFGFPEWKIEQIRTENRVVYGLDPDIAAKRSWSMAVKIATQRERNIKRAIEWLEYNSKFQSSSEKFRNQVGFWL